MATGKHYGSWVGDGITYIATIVPLAVLVWGLCSFVAVRWCVVRLVRHFSWVDSRASVALATVAFAFSVVLLFPALTFFSQPSALRRMDATLPLYLRVLETGVNRTRAALALFRSADHGEPGVRILRVYPATPGVANEKDSVVLHNSGNTDLDLKGWKLQDQEGATFPLSGLLTRGKDLTIQVPGQTLRFNEGCRILLTDPDDWPQHLMSCTGEQRFFDRFSLDRAQAQADRFLYQVDESAQRVERLLRQGGSIVGPVDDTAVVRNQPLPNVVILVLESFRSSAVSPRLMKRLDAFSAKGLRLDKHYSGSNCTHMGFFSLLYGRTPIFYTQTLDRNIPPQMCETMRLSGYRSTYVSGGADDGFRRIKEFINDHTFDKVIIDEQGATTSFTEWPNADRRMLEKIRKIVTTPHPQPQFVVSLLGSTHCPYVYPQRFQIHRPDGSDQPLGGWTDFSTELLNNRYKNAALFLEDELMHLIASVDLNRNILIITGDHGESMGEDGFRSHTGPASEVQTHVPLIMVGKGIKPGRIQTATGHTDILPTLLHQLAGRPVPIRFCHGRDLLADPHPADQALVVPLLWPELSKLVLIRGNKHILIDVKTQGDTLQSARFAAFLDDTGMYKLRIAHSPKGLAPAPPTEHADHWPGAPPKYRP